ncbi:MAG TPA: hypothetical protein VIC70_06250 [Gaiellaceae bacterium]|jgi:hypothetical protein
MSIVNRRNAVIGFLTVKAMKIVAREQAKKVGRKVTPNKSRKKRA